MNGIHHMVVIILLKTDAYSWGNGCCKFLNHHEHEQEHQFALTRKHSKPTLNKVQKGAWELVNQLCTLLREFQWVDFFIADPSSAVFVKIEVQQIIF